MKQASDDFQVWRKPECRRLLHEVPKVPGKVDKQCDGQLKDDRGYGADRSTHADFFGDVIIVGIRAEFSAFLKC